jgi:hypothetical protein
MLDVRDQHGAPRCPRCGDGAAPSGRTLNTILREVIRDLDSEITEPSALGVDMVCARHIRERLVTALQVTED